MISDKPSNIDLKSATGSQFASAPAPAKDKVNSPNVQQSDRTSDVPDEGSASAPVSPAVSSKSSPHNTSKTDELTAQALAEKRQEEVKQKVNDAIPKVRELMQKNQRSLDFKVAEKENRVIITVIDKETDKVIRQIPPEDLLQIAESIDQGLDGIQGGSILNSKA
jgi:flagellar protein FlaG